MEPRNLWDCGQAQSQSYNFLAGNELNLLNGLKQTHGAMLIDANDSNPEWHKREAGSGLGICCGISIVD